MNGLSRSVIELTEQLARRGIRLRADGGVLRYTPREAMTPALLVSLRSNKQEVLDCLGYLRDRFDPTEYYFANMMEADRRYVNPSLYGIPPTGYPPPCVWCGARLSHNPHCNDMRSTWEVRVPFGPYKGRKLSEVSSAALRRIMVHARGDEFRAAVQEELWRRQD